MFNTSVQRENTQPNDEMRLNDAVGKKKCNLFALKTPTETIGMKSYD